MGPGFFAAPDTFALDDIYSVMARNCSSDSFGEIVSMQYLALRAFAFLLTFFAVSSVLATSSEPATVSPADAPIPVSSLLDLYNIAQGNLPLSGHYVQTADIDGDETYWVGDELESIGKPWRPFTGSFDGAGFEIRDLKTSRPDEDFVGLFGFVSPTATITNVRVTNARMRGGSYVGGIAGYSAGTISECYITGSIMATDFHVGGIAGRSDGFIDRCYVIAAVSGSRDAGGIAGGQSGTVSDCFARGIIISPEGAGGLIGTDYSRGRISFSCAACKVISDPGKGGGLVGGGGRDATHCYWEIDPALQVQLQAGQGRTKEELTAPHAANTYLGWDFSTTWEEDITRINNGYPIPRWLGIRHTLQYSAGTDGVIMGEANQTHLPGTDGSPVTAVGNSGIGFLRWSDGSIENPRVDRRIGSDLNVTAEFARLIPVASLADLDAVRNDLAGHYIQIADIDASETVGWNNGTGFPPIGTYDTPFSGSFNGGGFRIRNLTINRWHDTYYIALFGASTQESVLSRVSLTNATIRGGEDVAGLVGLSEGKISKCFVTGRISGVAWVGAIAGEATWTEMDQCYANALVICSGGFVGGLAGAQGAKTANCFARGAVGGGGSVQGGLFGAGSSAVLLDSYAAGGVEHGGGLIGSTDGGCFVQNCFWDTETSGSVTITRNGGEGRTTDAITYPFAPDTYVGWDFENVWDAGDASYANNGYPFLRWQTARQQLHYRAGPQGSLIGETSQVRIPGANGTAVTAVPAVGAEFVRWSDGSTQNPRTDLAVVEDIDVTAHFERRDRWLIF